MVLGVNGSCGFACGSEEGAAIVPWAAAGTVKVLSRFFINLLSNTLLLHHTWSPVRLTRCLALL